MSEVAGAVIVIGILCAPQIIYIVRSQTKPNRREALEIMSGGVLLSFIVGSIVLLATYLFPPQNQREIGGILLGITWFGGCAYAWRLAEKERRR